MQKMTKEERKAYNAHVQERNENLRQASHAFGFLTIALFITAVFVPARFSFYVAIGAGFCGVMRIITARLAR